jgi:hypothetical protein
MVALLITVTKCCKSIAGMAGAVFSCIQLTTLEALSYVLATPIGFLPILVFAIMVTRITAFVQEVILDNGW